MLEPSGNDVHVHYTNRGPHVSDDALRAARMLAAGLDPLGVSERSGALFEPDDVGSGGCFSLRFLGDVVRIRFPEYEFEADSRLPSHIQALLVHYLARSDGATPSGEWGAFADLPNGRFYAAAFQGYTGNALVRRLAGEPDGIPAAIASLGGRPLTSAELATNADAAWVIDALPRVPVALLWWDADDEFPARAELLFDRTRDQPPADRRVRNRRLMADYAARRAGRTTTGSGSRTPRPRTS